MNRVPLEKKVLSENDRIAGELRERFREHGVLCLNLISSPGAGKTLLLERTLEGEPPPATPEEMSLRILVPAFMISELKRAFEIGFLLFLPFLIIDLVVASVLMSMGMMMLPPVVVSLPFKLIFFVLVDGWSLVAGSLVQSYGG